MDDETTRIEEAIEPAQDAFWEKIGDRYPEVKSGDLSPLDTLAFDEACRQVVRAWLLSNLPPASEPQSDVSP